MAGIQELFDLTGRIAIVTGGATHLGLAMSSALGELGATLVIASRRGELCEEVAATMRADGMACTGTGCDVTDPDAVNALVDGVVDQHGHLDIMVCNAGGSAPAADVPNSSPDAFLDTMAMNVDGTFHTAQAAAGVMVKQGYGKIITLGSVMASLGTDRRTYVGLKHDRSSIGYFAAKGAIVNLTRALATELAEFGVRVNCISPGQIPKPGVNPELVERFRQKNPLFRTGVTDDVKGAVALLASPAGDWITGHNLLVDGGWSAW